MPAPLPYLQGIVLSTEIIIPRGFIMQLVPVLLSLRSFLETAPSTCVGLMNIWRTSEVPHRSACGQDALGNDCSVPVRFDFFFLVCFISWKQHLFQGFWWDEGEFQLQVLLVVLAFLWNKKLCANVLVPKLVLEECREKGNGSCLWRSFVRGNFCWLWGSLESPSVWW